MTKDGKEIAMNDMTGMNADLVRELLPDLAFERFGELERDVIEGRGHTGQASVVQAIGRRVG